MTANNEELTKILELGKYARYIHTNLHVHTPATPWDWNSFAGQTRKADEISPKFYFDTLNQSSLELVAITDHNTIAWCEPLMKLAIEGRKQGTSKLHILPGVEITTYEGPHIIGVFPEDLSVFEKVRAMLVRFGLSGDGRADDRVSKNSKKIYTMVDVIDEIEEMGLVIAPHIHSKQDGIWGNKDFRSRYDVLVNPSLKILAAPSGDIKLVIDPDGTRRFLYKNMPSGDYKKSFAFINVSDCHRLDDLEVNTTWIKMGEPSLDGVKQIIYEPELRVSHELVTLEKNVEFSTTFHFRAPEKISYPHILGLSVHGGNLDGQVISFSPHQNSIIGKNYAGKSAILDLLRFGLDVLPQPGEQRYSAIAERLCGILKENGVVVLYLVGKDRRTYKISRLLTSSTRQKTKYIDGKPEIYSLIGDEFKRETDLSLEDIIDIEVYPQGEVVKIKDNASEQIRIIDSLGKIATLLEQIEKEELGGERTVLGKLLDNGNNIIQFQDKIESLTNELSGKSEIEKEIEELDKVFQSGQVEELKSWANINGKINGQLRSLDELGEPIQSILDSSLIDDIDIRDEKLSSDEIKISLESETSKPVDFESEVERIFQSTIKLFKYGIQKNLTVINTGKTLLQNINTEREKRYQKVLVTLQKINSSGLPGELHNTILERLTQKQERLAYLTSRETDLDEVNKDLHETKSLRVTLLENFDLALKNISAKRLEVVNSINAGAAKNIRADLENSGNKNLFRKLLGNIADGLSSNGESRFRDKTAQMDMIADAILPSELVKMIRENNVESLMSVTHITENTARIIMAMGERNIQKLEACPVYDKFQIKFKKEGDTEFTSIESGLSGGEQALALMSVAMIPKLMPLVIDQPEDELGPSLITNELVEQIRKVKNNRQLIFVTHVANIPVLGDSEQIAYVKQIIDGEQKHIIIDCNGALDDKDVVEKLLELDGGVLAFQKREERYSVVMPKKHL